MVDGLFPGRWEMLRPATTQEIKATTILSMEIDEGSAKIRTGPPGDDEADYALPIWAGVIPVVRASQRKKLCTALPSLSSTLVC